VEVVGGDAMDMEWVVGGLAIVGVILVFLVESVAYGGVGTWLELRAARSAEEVLQQVEQYGPEAPGLRLELLPEEQRRAILADRAHLEEKRARARASGRAGGG
jgi:hypothetical protein